MRCPASLQIDAARTLVREMTAKLATIRADLKVGAAAATVDSGCWWVPACQACLARATLVQAPGGTATRTAP